MIEYVYVVLNVNLVAAKILLDFYPVATLLVNRCSDFSNFCLFHFKPPYCGYAHWHITIVLMVTSIVTTVSYI